MTLRLAPKEISGMLVYRSCSIFRINGITEGVVGRLHIPRRLDRPTIVLRFLGAFSRSTPLTVLPTPVCKKVSS